MDKPEPISIDSEVKLLKALSKIFPDQREHKTDLGKKDLIYLDPANVVGIVPKSDDMKRLFVKFVAFDQRENKIPDLDYTVKDPKQVCIAKFGCEYLKLIINCYCAIDENPKMCVKNDFPLKFIGQHFDFILAPRIGDED